MGLSKTSYAVTDSDVVVWDHNGTEQTGSNRVCFVCHYLDHGVDFFHRYARVKLHTDASGVGSMSFTLSGRKTDGSGAGVISSEWNGPILWKVSTSSTHPPTSEAGWNQIATDYRLAQGPTSVSSGTVSVSLMPNTDYYLWLSYTNAGGYFWGYGTNGLTITVSGTYGQPGEITANNANFGSAVNMSYASSASGATYTVTVKVGSLAATTLQTKSSTSSRSWTPAVATYAPSFTTSKTVSCVISVTTYFGDVSAGTKTKSITLTFTQAQVGPSLASGAFSIAPYNTNGKSGYIRNHSKIRATYDSSKVSFPSGTGGSVSKWSVKFGSAAAVDVAKTTTTKDSDVISADTSVTCTLTDSRGFTASQTFTATLGTSGTITANNANFGSAVSISFAGTESGGKYTVTAKVGSLTAETLQTNGTATSLTWTPSLATYAPQITNASSASCVITVTTYYGGVSVGSTTKTITLSFTSTQVAPTLASGAFGIAARNTGVISGMTGYIQGYSLIRATYTSSKVTLKYNATVASWKVKFGTAAEQTVAASTTTKDSSTISATSTVTCTLVDSRGFTAVQSFTATMTPYQKPTLTTTAARTEGSTTVTLGYSGTYASVDGQNALTVTLQSKTTSASSYGTPVTVTGGTITTSGTNKINSKTGHTATISDTNTSYQFMFTITDSLGNSASVVKIVNGDKWLLHFRNKGAGAAFGKAAEADSVLDIGAWDLRMQYSSSVFSLKTNLITITSETISLSGGGYTGSRPVYKRGGICQLYFILGNGTDELTGLTSGTIVGTIPSGYRPMSAASYPMVGRAGTSYSTGTYYPAFVYIETDGSIKVYGNGSQLNTMTYILGSLVWMVNF